MWGVVISSHPASSSNANKNCISDTINTASSSLTVRGQEEGGRAQSVQCQDCGNYGYHRVHYLQQYSLGLVVGEWWGEEEFILLIIVILSSIIIALLSLHSDRVKDTRYSQPYIDQGNGETGTLQ